MPAESDAKPTIVFLCTGNSCRSQMAEGFARALLSDIARVSSAGTQPHGLNPLAVRAMSEAGIDISHHASKSMTEMPTPDLVITVCDAAHDSCPVIPGARILHAPFEDPPRLAADARTDEEALPHYRKVRDQIRDFVITLRVGLAPALQKPPR
ncbi:MAG: arsenate reductase ArsC [Phycisphaeraceae bacterium]|nr:arsenate reductase ArsC [Phycisphaeraceae bacterium]